MSHKFVSTSGFHNVLLTKKIITMEKTRLVVLLASVFRVMSEMMMESAYQLKSAVSISRLYSMFLVRFAYISS